MSPHLDTKYFLVWYSLRCTTVVEQLHFGTMLKKYNDDSKRLSDNSSDIVPHGGILQHPLKTQNMCIGLYYSAIKQVLEYKC